MAVSPVPKGYHSVTPYLVGRSAAQVIDFLKSAFDAVEIERMETPERVIHAEVRIGDSVVMLGEPLAGTPGMPATLYLYLPDVDAAYRRALQAGATSEQEPVTQFYGDRTAGVKDCAGNRWYLATHVEDVSQEELQRRAQLHAKK
jgi:uncharacterized glyoxalase superfamily protein PhnB